MLSFSSSVIFFFYTLNSSKKFTETANHLSYKLSVRKLSEVFTNNKATEEEKNVMRWEKKKIFLNGMENQEKKMRTGSLNKQGATTVI